MQKLVAETSGIQIELTPQEIKFTKSGKDIAPAFHIPQQFSNTAIEFYDLMFEHHTPTAIVACHSGYDIAIHLNEKTGAMIGWYYFK